LPDDREPPLVAICIATCRRPEGLSALLDSLNRLRVPRCRPEIRVVVVDNDPEAPARDALGDIGALSRWPLIYAMEPVQGVVAARNRLLSLVPGNADLVAFLDDDELVAPEWIAAMLATLDGTGATAVQGPVRPRYETRPPAWAATSGLFGLGPFEEGEPLNFAATNNVVVRKAFLDRHNLRFDMRFNQSGGEDEEFFARLRALGGIIVASADAVVVELVPAGRTRIGWLLRRKYRMGNTLGRIALLHRRGRLLRALKGFGAIFAGGGRLLTVGLVSAEQRVGGLLEFARGAGMLSAYLGATFHEYSRAAVARDRRDWFRA
jgi:succinoglycan biosynthesis protein ExoM